jgi:hypothetical protein
MVLPYYFYCYHMFLTMWEHGYPERVEVFLKFETYLRAAIIF